MLACPGAINVFQLRDGICDRNKKHAIQITNNLTTISGGPNPKKSLEEIQDKKQVSLFNSKAHQ